MTSAHIRTFVVALVIFSIVPVFFVQAIALDRFLAPADSGPDVTLLQKILNAFGTRVAESGPGSPEHETDYYGPLTASAVQAFQCENDIVCSGAPETSGFGLVGPRTRALLNALLDSLHALSSGISKVTQFAAVGAVDVAAGLVAHYTFDEGSGTTAGDSAGSSDGTLVNGPTWTAGKIGSGALSFDGADDYINFSSASLDNMWDNGGAVAFWVYPRTAGEVNAGFWVTKSSKWTIFADSSGDSDTGLEFNIGWSGGVAKWRSISVGITLNAWHHVALVYDTDSATNDPVLYVDGVVKNLSEIVAPSGTRGSDAGGSMQVGSNIATSRASDGLIDDMRFYGRALSAAEVARLYEAGGSSIPTPAPTPALIPSPDPTPSPSPVHGSCGTTQNTCTAGTLSDTTDSSTNYLWQCAGTNGGTTASCSLPIPSAVGAWTGSVTVASATELKEALKNAPAAGGTIFLKPGNYGLLNLYDKREPFVQFPSEVTIKSANTNNPAIITSLQISGVKNLTFDGIKFDYTEQSEDVEWTAPFMLSQRTNTNITFKNCIFDGDVSHASDPQRRGFGTAIGLRVDGGTSLTLEDNKFFTWHRAGTFGHIDGLTVRNNEIYDIRSDGFDFAQDTDVLIEGNYLHDFRKSAQSGDHMDMIQFWTSGTDSPSKNITIRNNILDSRAGDWTQSIFMRNELVDTGAAGDEMLYQNILIENNFIHNAHAHGITVGETNGLTIRNNTILHNVDAGNDGLVNVPTINAVAQRSKNVVIANNIVARLSVPSNTNATFSNNLVVQREFPTQDNYYGDIFFDGLAGQRSNAGTDFMARPGSVIEVKGVGAALTRFNPQPATPVGYVLDTPGVGRDLLTHTFAIGGVYGPVGALSVNGVSWKFGDGSSASGKTASHTYTRGGRYTVTASVSTNVGTVSIDKTIYVTDPRAIDLSFERTTANAGYAPDATITWVTPEYAAGKDGMAASFSRTSSPNYININGIDKLISGVKQLSYAFDLKPSGAAAGRPLWLHVVFGIYSLDPSSISTAWWDTVGDSVIHTLPTTAFSDGGWHRVGATYDGISGASKLYLDGKVVDEKNIPKNALSYQNRSLGIGSDPWGSQFTGLIDNVQVYQGVWPEIMSPDGSSSISQSSRVSPSSQAQDANGNGAASNVNDNDSDGIPDANDLCPKTLPNAVSSVDASGCPHPLASTFTIKPDFGALDLRSAKRALFELGKSGFGKISFEQRTLPLVRTETDGSVDQLNLDDAVTIGERRIGVDTGKIPEWDQPAKLTFYNVTIENPIIKRDGVVCPDCTIISYENGTLVVSVPGFSTYEIFDGSTPPPPAPETNTTGGGGGGGTSSKAVTSSSAVESQQLLTLLTQLKTLVALLKSLGGTVSPELEATVNALAPTTSSFSFTRNLSRHSEGEDVRQLQIFLNTNGYIITVQGDGAPGNETTYFGSLTEQALKRFQCDRNIVCSGAPATTGYGNFGPATRKAFTL